MRFEDYPTRKCDTCSEYYNERCDGRSSKGCRAYKPVRGVKMEAELKSLRSNLRFTKCIVGILVLIQIYQFVSSLGWY